MKDWMWILLGGAGLYLLMQDHNPGADTVATGDGGTRATLTPPNNTSSRAITDVGLRFQGIASDVVGSQRTVYGSGWGNQGKTAYWPLGSSADPSVLGTIGSKNQGGYAIGRGW